MQKNGDGKNLTLISLILCRISIKFESIRVTICIYIYNNSSKSWPAWNTPSKQTKCDWNYTGLLSIWFSPFPPTVQFACSANGFPEDQTPHQQFCLEQQPKLHEITRWMKSHMMLNMFWFYDSMPGRIWTKQSKFMFDATRLQTPNPYEQCSKPSVVPSYWLTTRISPDGFW